MTTRLLASAYLQAHLYTGDAEFLAVAEKTLAYMLTDLRSPEGGFYSARDADSEGEEGIFYILDGRAGRRTARTARGQTLPPLLRRYPGRQLRGPKHPPPAARSGVGREGGGDSHRPN